MYFSILNRNYGLEIFQTELCNLKKLKRLIDTISIRAWNVVLSNFSLFFF